MGRWMSVGILLCLAQGYDILQLTEEKTPLRVREPVELNLCALECANSLVHFTLSGWFETDYGVSQRLLSLKSSTLSVNLDVALPGYVQVWILGEETSVVLEAPIQTGTNWVHLVFTLDARDNEVSLSVGREGEQMQTYSDKLSAAQIPEFSFSSISLGSPTSPSLSILDLTLLPLPLSASESSQFSPFPSVLPSSATSLSSPTCQANGLITYQKYRDEDLYYTWLWKFGISIFGWDYEDFGVNFSTVKVVFDLNDVVGDPDMEVYIYHYFSDNEYLGESKLQGADSLTFDWNTPRFANGIDWDTHFRVYINGKDWFNWYSLYCNIYSTELLRSSSNNPVRMYTKTVVIQSSPWTWVLPIVVVGLIGLAGYGALRWKRQREVENRLLERLLPANQT